MTSNRNSLIRLVAIGSFLLGAACDRGTTLPAGGKPPSGGGTSTPVVNGPGPSGSGMVVQPTACKDGYMQCGDGACAPTRWDFETGDVQGWGPASTSTATVASTTSPKFEGQFALAGKNPTENFDVTLKVPICNSHPTNLTGKKVSARFQLDFPVVSNLKLGRTCLVWWDGDNAVTGTTCSDDLTPGWHEVTQTIEGTGSNVTAIGVEVQMFSGSSYSSAGTVYVDNVTITN